MMKKILASLLLATGVFAASHNIPIDTAQFSLQGSAPSSPISGTVQSYFLNADGFPYWKTSGGSILGYVYAASAFTNHGVLLGNGTRSPSVLGVCSDNTVFVGNTAADPSCRTLVNADINSAAAIAYSKLALGSSITSSDIVDGTIVNADVNAAAGIVYSKLSLASSIVNADIAAGAAIVYSKLSLAASILNSDLATMANHTIKCRNTAGTGAPEDCTATQVTAFLNALVGDSGLGGTKGLVPAPAAGDAAASKFLAADGTWKVPAGTGASGAASAVLTKTSDYIILTSDFEVTGYRLMVEANCSADCTMTLPAASNTGYAVRIINVGSATATIATAGSDTFGSNTDTTWILPPSGDPQSSNNFVANGGTRWDAF